MGHHPHPGAGVGDYRSSVRRYQVRRHAGFPRWQAEDSIQTVAIFLYILPLKAIAPWLGDVAFWVMMVALAITLWTGVEYVIQALKLRAAGRRA